MNLHTLDELATALTATCLFLELNFIVPFESDRRKWKTLRGINLKNEKVYRIAMLPDERRDTVVPESFRIILRQYLQHPEAKSLAPDGSACIGSTQGLLRRETIVAHKIAAIGKETAPQLGERRGS